MEGPASLRWLLNPADASSRLHAELPTRPAIEMEGVPRRVSSSDISSLFRQPLTTQDVNPSLNETPYPQSVSQSNKRRFDAIDGISAEQAKPKFYRNMTAIRAPPNPKLQQCHYFPVSLQPPKGRDTDGSLQCPYTDCPRAFEIYTQYDEMKAHYAQHARSGGRHIELENVNGSSFSFAPKKYTPKQGDWPPPKPTHNPTSPRHKVNPSPKPAHNTKRRRPSSEPHTLPSPVARTIYDVTHPSRAPPLPKAPKTSSPETHGPGRTIYDVHHPTARRSQRLAGKKCGGGDSLKGR